MAYNSTFGGISAVNPQAPGDYQQYIDAAFENAKGRLDPIFQNQNAAYQQSMVNRGIPVGGDAYNDSWRQLMQSQNDAYSNAAFDAMGFGIGVQNQDYTQDLGRSQLANALLRAQWGDETARYGIDTSAATQRLGISSDRAIADAQLAENARQFDYDLGYRYAGLGEGARQFDEGLGYDYASLGQQDDQFYAGLGQQGEQFYADLLADLYRYDTTMDYNYFNADRDDMRWLTELDYGIWNDQINANRWSDQLGNSYLNPYDPGLVNMAPIGSNQNANTSIYDRNRAASQAWWSNVTDLADIFGQNAGWW